MLNIRQRYVLLLCLLLFTLPPLWGAKKNTTTYKVQKGDNLYQLSKRFHTTVSELKELNKLKADNLSLGQSLVVPNPAPQKEKAPEKKAKTEIPTVEKPKTTPQEAVTPPATQQALSATENVAIPASGYHVVQRKETAFRIAKTYGIELKTLLALNKMTSSSLKVGQKLWLRDPNATPVPTPTPPPATVTENVPEPQRVEEARPVIAPTDSVLIEMFHIVQPKETLYKISKKYGVTVDSLKAINKLDSNNISVGQRLYIKTGSNRSETSLSTYTPTSTPVIKNPSKLRDDLIRPVNGKIISSFGLRNGRPHKGVDIGAATGTHIVAALDGKVVYSGQQSGYGNVVVLEHPDFVMTVYAHNERNLVAVGDVVKQGDLIATVGSTGNATTPHVHFEYRIKGKAIDPKKVLPEN